MAIKVFNGNEEFNGYFTENIRAVNGVAIFEDEEFGRRYAKQLGYQIIEDNKAEEKKVEEKKTTTRKRTTKTNEK